MAEVKKTTKKTATKTAVKAAPKKAAAVKDTGVEVKESKTKVIATTDEPTVIAKAGKRSAKAVKETEAKEAKEVRKAQASEETAAEKPTVKKTQKPARSKLERSSKKFRKVSELIDKTKSYELKDGLELAIKTTTTKFDATVEMHIKLGVDPRQADQNVRDTVLLPAGSGKTVRIAIFAEEAEAADAKKAGADVIGIETITKLLDKETLSFDVLIATPAHMAKLGKYARLLGPRGLMPNPKSGTVTTDLKKAVSEAKAGRVEYRVDSTGIIHLGIGKVSFGADKLEQNATAVLTSLRSVKPASIKGNYIQSAYLATTMGPSIKLSTAVSS